MNLYHAKMLALAEKLLLQVFNGDLKNKLSGEEIVHWYGAFLVLGRSFSTMMASHGITPAQLDQIRDVAIGPNVTRTAKA